MWTAASGRSDPALALALAQRGRDLFHIYLPGRKWGKIFNAFGNFDENLPDRKVGKNFNAF